GFRKCLRLDGFPEQFTNTVVEKPELGHKFGRESSITVLHEFHALPKTCHLVFQSLDSATESVSFRDKALNCSRRLKKQAFNILDRVNLVCFTSPVGFVHNLSHSCAVCCDAMRTRIAKINLIRNVQAVALAQQCKKKRPQDARS